MTPTSEVTAPRRTLVVLSGGIDSVVLAHQLVRQGETVHCLSVDYGQRHVKEHEFAAETVADLGVGHTIVELGGVGAILPGNSLTDPAVAVPAYAGKGSGRENVVPNRNVILLSVAFAQAAASDLDRVAIGTVAGDGDTGPDCSREFLDSFNAMQSVALAGFARPHLAAVAPLIGMQKHEVVKLGASLGVRFARTWSCFRGEDVQCGVCATCYDRRRAFELSGVADPTEYQT